MAAVTAKKSPVAPGASDAERQFLQAQGLWNLLVISLPVDFLVAGDLGAWLLRGYNPEILALGILVFALVLSSREVPLRAMSYLRKLKYSLETARQSSRLKAALIFGVLILLTGLELMIHLFNLSWNAVGVAVAAIALLVAAGYRSFREMKDWNAKLAGDPRLSAELANSENLVVCVLPVVLLRAAALAASVALVSHLSLTSGLIYAAVLLSFQKVYPQKGDFFQSCRRCAGKFPRTVMENTICPGCAARR